MSAAARKKIAAAQRAPLGEKKLEPKKTQKNQSQPNRMGQGESGSLSRKCVELTGLEARRLWIPLPRRTGRRQLTRLRGCRLFRHLLPCC